MLVLLLLLVVVRLVDRRERSDMMGDGRSVEQTRFGTQPQVGWGSIIRWEEDKKDDQK